MLYLLKTDADQEKLNAALKEIEKDPNRLEGTLELVYEMMADKECGSYKNNRIMWLGWQLEERGIHVTWDFKEPTIEYLKSAFIREEIED